MNHCVRVCASARIVNEMNQHTHLIVSSCSLLQYSARYVLDNASQGDIEIRVSIRTIKSESTTTTFADGLREKQMRDKQAALVAALDRQQDQTVRAVHPSPA